MKCKQCKTKKAVKKFCSLECYWKSLKGRAFTPRRKRIKTQCLECGKELEIKKDSPNQRKFCSKDCYNEYQKGRKLPSRGGIQKIKCQQCGKEFIAWRYEDRKYCSKKCNYEAAEERFTGSNNHNWKGGISLRPLNTKEYKAWRKAVMERDNYICQKCDYSGGRILNAHHKKDWANYPSLRFDINNGITLCKNCHKLTKSFGKKSALSNK